MLQAAALAVVLDGNGHILTVGRPAPPFEQAIPGGHVDPGEGPRRAALRELHEETGIVGEDAQLIWVASSPTDGRTVYVYLVRRWHGAPYAREGFPVAWQLPRQLVAQGTLYGRFTASMFRGLPWLAARARAA